MNLKEQFFNICEYRITEGSNFQWGCYGDHAYCLDSWNGEQDGHSFTIIFDTKTQDVYELQAHDYKNNRAYRWFNPEFREDFMVECADRGSNPREAWDDLEYTELEVVEDFFEKMEGIYNEEDYDTRIRVPIDFTDEELLKYMTMAHERDMTFNEFVEEALRSAIEEAKRDPEGFKQRTEQFVNSRK